ncbi:DNA mismatch repair protein MutS [Pelagerythrobacter rhizovicinus]|uniref:DNA mismatch repair protein MutS n=1 Tax=Pelagerythrobacter rhizovicinus TaxID=2268576 RepID=A0A4Q2KH13_9SPHN|nr:Smr/MutS family protein [Pelagerythrobacter rhizovicinus]RXZ64418.1 DNA mismatch repair protein MutS [Pelagerythrobacter rhizovicinus]
MSAPRGLSEAEKAAWERLAATVTPLHPLRPRARTAPANPKPSTKAPPKPPAKSAKPPGSGTRPVPLQRAPASAPSAKVEEGLDSHWERRFKAGSVAPDFTLDLHGHTLDAAHARLESGLFQAKAMGARVILLIAGKPRPVDAADRGSRRGAIRAKILDWLAAGPHGSDIAAIRKAHRRHGGEGALYLVLKRRR